MLKIIIPLIFFAGLIIPVYAMNAAIPVSFEPVRVWDEYQMIFEGVITDIVNLEDAKEYHIHVNHYFKTGQKFDSIIAYGDIEMQKQDRALFLIYDNGNNYQISEYSMPIMKSCHQTERMHLFTIPNISLYGTDKFPGLVNQNSCLPEHFVLVNKEIIAPTQSAMPSTKQLEEGKSIEQIWCSESMEMVFKYDRTPACVTPDTKEKLLLRGWSA